MTPLRCTSQILRLSAFAGAAISIYIPLVRGIRPLLARCLLARMLRLSPMIPKRVPPCEYQLHRDSSHVRRLRARDMRKRKQRAIVATPNTPCQIDTTVHATRSLRSQNTEMHHSHNGRNNNKKYLNVHPRRRQHRCLKKNASTHMARAKITTQ